MLSPTTSSGGTAASPSAGPRSSRIRRTAGCLRGRPNDRRTRRPPKRSGGGRPDADGGRRSGYNNHVHVLQSPGYVAIFQEQIHDFRIIPVFDQPELPDQVRLWLGVSRGHWDGDTLVVETTNFHAQTDYLGSGPNRRVVERFRRRGEDAIEYSFTVTDPSVWTREWSAMVPWRPAEGPIFEYACHEGNYGMTNLLTSSRAVEAGQ